MRKIATVIATSLILAAGISGASAAGLSGTSTATAYSTMASCDALNGDSSDWKTTPLADKLATLGESYDSISTFGNCFQVIKSNADGSKELQLYDPSTLSRIAI